MIRDSDLLFWATPVLNPPFPRPRYVLTCNCRLSWLCAPWLEK